MRHIPNGITRFNQIQRLDENLRKMYGVIGNIRRNFDVTIEGVDALDEFLRDQIDLIKYYSCCFTYNYILDSRVRNHNCFTACHSLLVNLHFINKDIQHNEYVTWKDGHDWEQLYRQVKFDLEQIQKGLMDKDD